MSNKTLNLTNDLYQYLLKISLREHPVLTKLREATASLPEVNMQIAPEQGQFMQLLLKMIGAKTCIEVGVFTGYSTLATALAIPEDGTIIACDINRKWTDIAKPYWSQAGVDHKITLKLQPAMKTLQDLLEQGNEGTFDFVFFDADKENYVQYYEASLPLIKKGGLMAFDNVFWGGAVIDPDVKDEATETIRNLNRKLVMDDRVDISVIPIADGLTLALKK